MSTVQLKRSATASKVPTTTDLALGELAINTYDGRLYFKKDPGTPSIVSVMTTSDKISAIATSTSADLLSIISDETGSGNLVFSTSATLSTPTINGVALFNGNVTISAAITANGSVGSAGQVLTSNATGTYWSTLQTIQPRVVTTASATSITINADTTDIAYMNNTQVAGTFTINAPTGTLVNGQKLMFKLISTNVQTFSWNAIFVGSTDVSLPTASTGSSKADYVGFIYDSVASKWQLLAKNFGF